MSYYSPDAISTDNQKAPCTFELAVPQLTALNAGAKIENGTKLELPLWLAEMLAVSKPTGQDQSSLATLDLPPALGHRVMNALRADPKSVDVRAQAQFFYGMGERMLELFDDDELVDVLMDVSIFTWSLWDLVLMGYLDVQTASSGDRRQGPEYEGLQRLY